MTNLAFKMKRGLNTMTSFNNAYLFKVVKRLDYVLLLFQLPQNLMFNSMHYLPLLSKCKNVQVISEWKFSLEDKDQLCMN